jgi:hypothetical protein
MELVAHTTSACRRCGGNERLACETVTYTAVGPRVVELRNVAVRRCSVCGHLGVDVPDVRALDVLVRCHVHRVVGSPTKLDLRREYARASTGMRDQRPSLLPVRAMFPRTWDHSEPPRSATVHPASQ